MKVITDGFFDFYASKDGKSKDKLLFSLKGYGENLSKLPVAQQPYEPPAVKVEPILDILNNVAEIYKTLCKIPKDAQTLLCILEVAGKLIKMCVQHHRPYNILELGAEQGLLSYFLTYIAREFNNENMVHCVSGNLLSQEWLLLLQEYGDAAENLNLHITSAQTLSLQENYFDFCVINGSENFPNPDEILNNAIRVLKSSGILIFVSQDGKVIEQKISLEQKQAAHRQTKEANINLQKDEMNVLLQQVKKRFDEIEKLTKEELRQLVKDLAYLEKLAVKLFEDKEFMNLKCKLNTAKENVLNILYAPNHSTSQFYKATPF